MKKTIIFCAAGTGGHLFPAQQLAAELQDEYQIVFAGKNLSKNSYFNQKNFHFLEINAATFSFKKPIKLLKASFAIIQGVCQSISIVHKYKPSLMIGFGSFFSLPLLLAAKVTRVPIILHEQNVLPGRVNRFFSRHALFLATTFPETKRFVKGKIQQVPFPRRLSSEGETKKKAAAYFGLSLERHTLLIFGGSQGALFVNQLAQQLAIKLQGDKFQLLHFVGTQGDVESLQKYYKEHKIEAVVKNFETHMQKAYLLADLAICRAGAATINELLEFELPAFLIPFPLATDDHQTKNAEFFSHTVQGGWCCAQKNVDVDALVEIICSHTAEKLLAKKKNIREHVAKESVHSRPLSTLIREIR